MFSRTLVVLAFILSTARAATEPKWTNAFWFWKGSAQGGVQLPPVDVLYIQAGDTGGDRASLPNRLPAAHIYWLVYRRDREGLPSPDSIRNLASSFVSLSEAGRKRGLSIAGIQLDVDAPTGALPEYAKYLHLLRQRLPAGAHISITALLDWFRSGTSVGAVVGEVDEFIPQFYDLEPSSRPRPMSIAAPIDAKRWGPGLQPVQPPLPHRNFDVRSRPANPCPGSRRLKSY